MDTGSRSRKKYTVLSVEFKNVLLCDTIRDWRFLDIFGKLVFADKRGFSQ